MKRLMKERPAIIESPKVSRDGKKVVLRVENGEVVFDGGMPSFSISGKTPSSITSITVDSLEDALAFAHSIMGLLIGSFGIEILDYLDDDK